MRSVTTYVNWQERRLVIRLSDLPYHPQPKPIPVLPNPYDNPQLSVEDRPASWTNSAGQDDENNANEDRTVDKFNDTPNGKNNGD